MAVTLAVLAVPAAAAPASPRDLLQVQWIRELALSPDGKLLAFAVRRADIEKNRWTSNLWLLSTAEGGSPRPLTNTPGTNAQPTFSPDGKRIAFVSDRGGDRQIWVIPVDGGEAIQLTRIATGAARPLWSPDGKWIAFASRVFPDCPDDSCNAKRLAAKAADPVQARLYDALPIRHWNAWRDERRSHVLLVPADGGSPRDLTPGAGEVPPFALASPPGYAFSPDGKLLAYVANTDPAPATSTNNDVFEVTVAGGEARRVSTGSGNDHAPRYSPEGRHLAWLSMARAGYEADRQRILVRDRERGGEVEWTRGFAGQPAAFTWAPDGKTLYLRAPWHGHQDIHAATPDGVRPVSARLFAKELLASSDGRLYFTHESADRPPEVHAIGADGKNLRRLTDFNGALVARLGWRAAEHHWFEGANGAKVHALLVRPPGLADGQRAPALVLIHGSPQNMLGDDFHPRWSLQMLAASGTVVFGINFHGSSGFGQEFTDAITGDLGTKPMIDILKGTDFMEAQPYIDRNRTAAAGASYGGYMMAWLNGHTDRFQAMICHAGVYNWHSMMASDIVRSRERPLGTLPWGDLTKIDRQTPQRYAANFKTPTLVLHGEKDYRVPVTQGFEYYNTLRIKGVPCRLVYFPDENHWVLKPQNSRLWHQEFFAWLDKYIGHGPTP
jgi:dipeptidyl aminopeptidase/acylaminoacyl peptidase